MKIKKQIYREGIYKEIFAQGVRVDNILYLAGQVGSDADGNTPESLEKQITNIYQGLIPLLEKFGATLDNVVDELWFVTDVDQVMANVEPIFAARQKIYGRVPEVAQTFVGVTALASPEYKVEIKFVAHL